MDVLVVASHRDYEITARCLRNLFAYLTDRGGIYLATDRTDLGRDLLAELGLPSVTVVPDASLLSVRERRLPGWYRQQVVKLRAGGGAPR